MTVEQSSQQQQTSSIPKTKITNHDHLNEERQKHGVLLLDVYSKWAGPCEAVQGLFRRYKQEFGEEITILQADADSCPEFKRFRNQSMPAFLFFANGILTQVVRGANGPLLDQIVREQIQLSRSGETPTPLFPEDTWSRNNPVSPAAAQPKTAPRPTTATNPEAANTSAFVLPDPPAGEEYTLALVKPNAAENAEAVRQRILQTEGLKIVHERWVVLTRDQAGVIYEEHKTKPFYKNLAAFVTCGPILALALQGPRAVERWRKLMGSANPKKAQADDPTSLRALYGVDNLHNAVHGSDTSTTARAHIQFLFSNVVQSPAVVPNTHVDLMVKGNRTICVLKPALVQNFTLPFVLPAFRTGGESIVQTQPASTAGASRPSLAAQSIDSISSPSASSLVHQIIYQLLVAGFNIERMEQKTVTEFQLNGLASIHNWPLPIDPSVSAEWTTGSSILISLSAVNAAEQCHDLFTRLPFDLPPKSFYIPDTAEVAHRALDVFYPHATGSSLSLAHRAASMNLLPKENTVALIKPDSYSNAELIIQKIKENGFQIVQQQEMTFTLDVAKQFYKSLEEKPFYDELVTFMSSGPMIALVLNKENGVAAWRELIGPVDAVTAKQTYPNTLRAIFGKDRIQNALYGSDSVVASNRDIQMLFPNLEPATAVRTGEPVLPPSDNPKDLNDAYRKNSAAGVKPGTPKSKPSTPAKTGNLSRPSSAGKLNSTSKPNLASGSQPNIASAGVSASKPNLSSSKANVASSASKKNLATGSAAQLSTPTAQSASKADLSASKKQLPTDSSPAPGKGSRASLAPAVKTTGSKSQLSGSKPELSAKSPAGASRASLAGGAKKSADVSKSSKSINKP